MIRSKPSLHLAVLSVPSSVILLILRRPSLLVQLSFWGTVSSLCTMSRLVRLVNVFKLSHQYQVFLSAFKQVWLVCSRICVLGHQPHVQIHPRSYLCLLLLCYLGYVPEPHFYALGMEFFSNILVPTDPYVASSSYGANNYYANNFDNLARAFVTLFEQMVVNNWPIVMEGVVAATQNWVYRFFFILFYVSTVMIVLHAIICFMSRHWMSLLPSLWKSSTWSWISRTRRSRMTLSLERWRLRSLRTSPKNAELIYVFSFCFISHLCSFL